MARGIGTHRSTSTWETPTWRTATWDGPFLNYLRAEELSPRDPDIIANLDLVRSRTVDQLQAEGDSLVASVADFGRQWATTTEYGLAALLLWAIVGLSVVERSSSGR